MVEKKLDLRSDEFQDILDKIPSWILRWGIVILSFFFLSILIGSYFLVMSSKMVGNLPKNDINFAMKLKRK